MVGVSPVASGACMAISMHFVSDHFTVDIAFRVPTSSSYYNLKLNAAAFTWMRSNSRVSPDVCVILP